MSANVLDKISKTFYNLCDVVQNWCLLNRDYIFIAIGIVIVYGSIRDWEIFQYRKSSLSGIRTLVEGIWGPRAERNLRRVMSFLGGLSLIAFGLLRLFYLDKT